MKKLIVILLTICMSVSAIFATGCKKSENTNTDTNTDEQVNSLYYEPESFAPTDKVLISNRKSDYQIVIPDTPTAMEKYAAEELQGFLYKSTGCKLNIISDKGLIHDNSNKYLSIGNTTLLEAQTDIEIDLAVMGETGPTIIRKDNTVYMAGAAAYGTLYSVYRFLRYEINFKGYSIDCVGYDYYDELYLLDFNYQYRPLMQYVYGDEYPGADLADEHARMYQLTRFSSGQGALKMFEGPFFGGYFCHTLQWFLPQAQYPQFYKNNQVCMTNEDAIACVSENLCQVLSKGGATCVNLGMNDYPSYCDCEDCLEAYDKYTTGGVMIRFTNAIAEYIEEKFQEQGIDRKVTISPLMYYNFSTPPVKKDSNGNYVVVDESCVPKVGQINVAPMYTPITSCFNHYYDEECTTNATTKEEILGWRAITDKLFTFTYTGYFPGYNTFFNDVIYMANQFKWYAENDIRFDFYYPEGNTSDISIMMTPLKVFLRSELAWNPYQDVNELIHDFMMHYYGVGGEDVEKYFYALNEHYEYIYNTLGNSCVFALSTISAAKYWPRSTLLKFETYMQNAMAKNTLSDYTEQDKKIYHDRLFKEYFLVYYNEYLFYSAYFTAEEKELAQRYIDEYVPKYYIPM